MFDPDRQTVDDRGGERSLRFTQKKSRPDDPQLWITSSTTMFDSRTVDLEQPKTSYCNNDREARG